jgi:hypothetical protein
MDSSRDEVWPYKIIRNQIQCPACKDVIESCHQHDFLYCSCEDTFVDGGKMYLRRGFKAGVGYIELSVTDPQIPTGLKNPRRDDEYVIDEDTFGRDDE